jgi:2-iminobutanoate/2-iminopropanoate deaminase
VKRQVISTAQGPRTGLPYSQAIRHGDLVFVAGQVALDPATGQVVEGGVQTQTRRVLDNIQIILQAAGTSLAHAVEAICFLRNIGDFAAFNEVYKTYVPVDPPARTTVQAVLPREGLLVEIRVVAAMPRPAAGRATGSPRPARRRAGADTRGRRSGPGGRRGRTPARRRR